MIVLAQKYGQLGNRLSYLRVYLAVSLEYDIKILDLSFDEYSSRFICESNTVFRVKGICSLILRTTLHNLIRFNFISEDGTLLSFLRPDSEQHVRLVDNITLNKCIRKHVLICGGWPIIDWITVKKHDEKIRKYFTPVKHIVERVESFIQLARECCDILVGIHIRQGDYRIWNDGRYYFESSEYVLIMKKVLEMHPDCKIKFIISTNENQDWDLFSSFNYVKAPGNDVVDLYVLAGCNEIYGPQSSFSGWSSFWGRVPLRWIDNPLCFDKALEPMQ